MSDLVSIIIPTLNEEDNVPRVLELISEIEIENAQVEIIFVDDMSEDLTQDVIKSYSADNIRLVISPARKGLGNALNLGVGVAKGQFILFLDCDCSVSAQDLSILISQRSLQHVAIGSRYLSKSKVIGAPKIKVFVSRVLNFLVAKYLGINANDLSHSLRVFPNTPELPSGVLTHPGYFWEHCLILKFAGYDFLEIPVVFTERRLGVTKNSSIRMLRSVFETLRKLKSLSK